MLLKSMAIENILNVMTMENSPELDCATILLDISLKGTGTFVWGVKYIENGRNQAELVYEAHQRIYSVKLGDIDGLIGRNSELYGSRDYRLEFFKSSGDYKKFFKTLSRWFKEGKIGERDYAIMLDKFKLLYRDLPSLTLGEAISTFHGVPNPRIAKLMEAKETLSTFPIVQRICSEAQISLL